MPLFHLFLLALIQGVTEFLPVSSSGHLLLFHKMLEQDESQLQAHAGLLLDIGVHVGTLLAVIAYFWRDIRAMIFGIVPLCQGRIQTHAGARMNMNIIISSIPVIIAGLALHMWDPTWLRETWIVAASTIIFGAALWWADEAFPAQSSKQAGTMGVKDAILIGLSQVLALIPGTSRSGITMTASRMLGYSRTQAARYSLLLSVVAISGAGVLAGKDVLEFASADLMLDIAISAAIACVSALLAIAVMMSWLEKQSFKIFALYRFALGGVLILALSMGWIA